ncbi:PucR family transcriptional regulator [Paenarthrobacter sp. PH39-S1]|uniref:PucR family transcriptional regulator n=1 Tax=Micrococcaceae TaxID=1268 RepID=UPI0024BAC894|nr:PucR family transcriptional regulator [Paenarthrobacter sp. PH39-S1]MDJ0354645.1 PucR family transcriptional regulator [Paenarthrobacter sp. PH39-S1]
MVIPLAEVLESDLVRQGRPRVRAGRAMVAVNSIRWVHSSEVLQIAPLLRGEELLLTGGSALLGLKPAAQQDYIRRLAERHVSALIIETAGLSRPLSPELIQAADESALPLIEFQSVVPFVDIAEDINRRIVSRQIAVLQSADLIGQRLMAGLASGATLSALLELLAESLKTHVALIDLRGAVLETAGEPAQHADPIEVDIFIGGIVTAKLAVQRRAGTDASVLRTIGERLSGTFALALSQRHQPTLSQIADTTLMRAVVDGSGPAQVKEYCRIAGFPTDQPVLMMEFRRIGLANIQGAAERAVRRCCPGVRTYQDAGNVYALIPLGTTGTRQRRVSILVALEQELAEAAVTGVMGPTVVDATLAHWSLSEAKLAHSLGPASKVGNNLWDSENFVVERLAGALPALTVGRLTQELVGELLEYDKRRGTSLLETLDQWLVAGCNTAVAARMLFLERQSMHNRLTRIFELLGGDPRGTGKMAGLHLAVRLATTLPHHVHASRLR